MLSYNERGCFVLLSNEKLVMKFTFKKQLLLVIFVAIVVQFIESVMSLLNTADYKAICSIFHEIISVRHFDAGRRVVKRCSQLLILCISVYEILQCATIEKEAFQHYLFFISYTLFNKDVIFQDQAEYFYIFPYFTLKPQSSEAIQRYFFLLLKSSLFSQVYCFSCPG